jgi:hypothetical protein
MDAQAFMGRRVVARRIGVRVAEISNRSPVRPREIKPSDE